MARSRELPPRTEDGFTLIELMMVVLIIAVLIAIALPAFTSARSRADEAAARSVLGNGHRALKATLADAQEISTVTTVELESVEPALVFQDGATAAEAEDDEVSVAVGANYVILATHSRGDGCIGVRELNGAPTQYQRIAGPACPASAFDPVTGWVDDWPPRP